MAAVLAPFLIFGTFSLVYGGKVAIDRWRLVRNPAHAQGTVIGLSKYSRGDYLAVRYRGPTGESVEFRSRVRVSTGSYKVGQEVGVLYDPLDPKLADIDDSGARYEPLVLPLFGAGILSVCLAVIGIAVAVQRVLHRKAAQGA